MRLLLAHPDIDPNAKNAHGYTAIMYLLQIDYDPGIARGRLQALVESDKVDLGIEHPHGMSLEDLAR